MPGWLHAGLDFLHTRDPAVVHRDLHMGNVLMKNGRPKISDLGQSRVVVGRELTSRRTRVKLTALPGRPDVMAPEALTGDYGTPLDIFSFGLMLCQVREQTAGVVWEEEKESISNPSTPFRFGTHE